MKTMLTAAALAVLLSSVAALPAIAHPGHDEAAAPAAAVPQTAEGQGVIRAIDGKAGTVTIQHGPIPALKWPAMNMKFKLASPAVVRGVKVGSRVHFVLRNDRGKPVVTQIHRL